MARPRARAAVAPLPRGRKRQLPARRFLPSGRSLLAGFGILAVAAGLYGVARQTSAFAMDTIEVVGAPPAVRAQVSAAVAGWRGRSLLSLDGAALQRQVAAVPGVVSAAYDRSFPHTLRIEVVPETPVAVVRQGAKSWIVSARGRVVARAQPHAAPGLARIWIPRTTPVAVGGFLPANHAAAVARALALTKRFPARIVLAAIRREGLVFRLRNGVELRLGEPADIRLKLAVAREALRRLPPGSTYVDVSVPGRPVAGNSQVSGRD